MFEAANLVEQFLARVEVGSASLGAVEQVLGTCEDVIVGLEELRAVGPAGGELGLKLFALRLDLGERTLVAGGEAGRSGGRQRR